MIRIAHIANVLDAPHVSEDSLLEWRPGLRIDDCAPSTFNLDGGHVILHNHKALTGEEVDAIELRDGDELVFAGMPGIWESIFGAAFVTANAIWFAVATFVALAGISIGLSYGIAALTAPKRGLNTAHGDLSDGPARNFEGIQDTAGAGRPIPFVYGRVRTGGHFLQSFERAITGQQVADGLTTLHTLMGIGIGPMKSITAIEINGNQISTIADVTTEKRLGTADQAPMDGFAELVFEVIHQRPIRRQDGWLTFITTRTVEAVEITFRFPGGLLQADKRGNPHPYDVAFEVELREFGAGSNVIIATATKTVSAVSRNPIKGQVKVEGLKLSLYEIKIRRTTLDDEEQPNSLAFNSISEVYALSEIVYEPKAHPGIAMVGLKQVPSAQLNSQVPTNYTFLVEGFDNVRIYSDASTYALGWTDNPAWCCAHFITSLIHGLGDKYDWTNLDIPAFLAWAQYCDAPVADGEGGTEKRATFNHVFDVVEPADETVGMFAQGSGAIVLKRGSKWTVVLDQVDAMVWVANEGNMAPGTFRLDYLPAGSIANRIQVAYADEDRNYERETYFDELPDIAPGAPYVEASRSLWGVTRRSQVAREVRRLLLHNKLGRTEVSLESGLDALRLSVGSVFGVATLAAGIGKASGRLLAVDSTLSQLTIDDEVTIEAGKVYEIVVHHAAGDAISTKRVVNAPGATEVLFAQDTAWAGAIAPGDTYSLGEFESAVEKYRCVECTVGHDFRRRIRGRKYDPAVYTFELDSLPTRIVSGIPDPRLVPPDPTDMTVFERPETNADGSLQVVLDVDWLPPISAILDHFEVWARIEGSLNFDLKGVTHTGHFTIYGVLAPGFTYEVSVVAVSANGMRKAPASGVKAFVMTAGIVTQPPNPVNLRASIIDGSLVAVVDPIPEEALGLGGHYEWRIGSTWNQSVLADKTKGNRLELKSYARGSTSILVKAVNSIGNKSKTAASTAIILYGQIEENIVLSQEESPSWPGVRTGFTIEGGTNKLSLLQPAASNTIIHPRGGRGPGPRYGGFGTRRRQSRSASPRAPTRPASSPSPPGPLSLRAPTWRWCTKPSTSGSAPSPLPPSPSIPKRPRSPSPATKRTR